MIVAHQIQRLALEQIDETHLVRDRLAFDDEAMDSLVESLRTRGQQTPIEAVELEAGRYGLISGWRRLTALKRLFDETGEARFATVLAILRRPAEAADSYVAMVEENEIRVGLSYYERARIVVRAVEEGVYPAQKPALQGLFASASRAKRSKIKSFTPIVEALDGVLAHPTEIGERLGLRLGKALEQSPELAGTVAAALAGLPERSAEAETDLLTEILQPAPQAAGTPPPASPEPEPQAQPAAALPAAADTAIRVFGGPGRLVLKGPGITEDFVAAPSDWVTRWNRD